jgi:beta-RFAP synthase
MIEIRACARLHLGLLDYNGEQGRLYGSIGLAVDRPYLILRAEPAEELCAEGLETSRVDEYARRFIRQYECPAGARLKLLSGIPAHVGLGSGTQIALAVGTALARIAGLRLSSGEIALAVGRGMRSGIGIAAFRRGGFVLDGGRRTLSTVGDSAVMEGQAWRLEEDRIPPVLFQHSVPRDWFFVTVVPHTDRGFSGETEDSAFLHLPVAPASLVEKISRLLLMKMLPGLVEKDILEFGRALTEIQRRVGDFFASVQGGRYSNPLSERLIGFLLERGAAGAGQSSWGPAVYGVVEGKARAQLMSREAKNFLSELRGGQVFCMRPHNRGAQIRCIEGINGKAGPVSP